MDNTLALGIGALVAALYLAAVVYALVQVHRTADLGPTGKTIWTIVVILAPVLGGVVWYMAGPHLFGLLRGTPPSGSTPRLTPVGSGRTRRAVTPLSSGRQVPPSSCRSRLR